MINRRFRLINPFQISIDFVNEKFSEEKIIVKPIYESICIADQRYFQGQRAIEVMRKKLPMSLIHEAVGEVLLDPKKEFEPGTKVVMIPNKIDKYDEIIKENYIKGAHFRGSGYDGFMQDLVNIRRNRVIPYKNIEDKVAVFLELVSVAMNALEHYEKRSHKRKNVIGIWGNGSLGFITSLVLKKHYPNSTILIFGVKGEKLEHFSFADQIIPVDEIPEGCTVDHAFECVGSKKSEVAINQIIDIINPEGTIALMGVSEEPIEINTRMILEKGITLVGNSRSSYEDFERAIDFLENNKEVQNYLKTIISDEIVIKNVEDISKAFKIDSTNNFKTIMKWEI